MYQFLIIAYRFTFLKVCIRSDFNCVLNGTLDRIPPSGNRERGNSELIEMMKQFNLDDIFRKRFQTKQYFKFSRVVSKSRTDFILTSSLLDSSIKKYINYISF